MMNFRSFKSSASLFSNKSWSAQHLLWLGLLSIIWLGTLGWRHLIPSDEGRYAEIAREMFISGNWIVPRYNDYLYFEKPPLQMWATALAFQLFGIGDWQARLWSGLTSLLSIVLVGVTCRRIWGFRVGTISALILASSPLWIIGGHFNSLDMGVAFFMSSALCCLMLALHAPPDSQQERNWMLACWVMMALSVLSKGLIGVVLPGFVLACYSLTAMDWASWKRMHWVKGLMVFFLIVTPWFVLIIQSHPSFYHFFFIHEHFERFTTNEHQRTAPWHFFLPLIAVGFLPWLIQLPSAINCAIKELQTAGGFKPIWLCFCWVIAITFFFSLSKSKLPGYILPILPALAIITGVSVAQFFEKKKTLSRQGATLWQIQLIVFGLLIVVGFLFISKVRKTGEYYEVALYATYAQIVTLALVIGVIGSITAWIYRHNAIKSFLIFSMSVITLSLTAGIGHEAVGRLLSGYDMAQKAKPFIQATDPLYSVGMLDHTVPYYLQHTVIMVNYKDELEFGITQEPDRWIPSEEAWIAIWQQHPDRQAFAMMSWTTYDQLLAKGVKMQVISEDPLRIVVGKRQLTAP